MIEAAVVWELEVTDIPLAGLVAPGEDKPTSFAVVTRTPIYQITELPA